LSLEVIGAGTTYAISWTSYAINYVRIEYSINGDTIFNSITPFAPAANGIFYWNVPANISATNCKIKISNAANTSIFALNLGVFSIQTGSFNISSGNTTSTLTSGVNQQINWISQGVSNYVKIEYSADSLNWITEASNIYNAGNYIWSVPYLSSDSIWYKVSDVNNPSVFDINNKAQNLIAGNPYISIVVTSSTTIYPTNSSLNLSWIYGGVSLINIDYSSDGGANWLNIASNVLSNTNNFIWNTPNSPIANGILRLSDAVNTQIFDTITFTTALPFLSLIAPNGGETWYSNSVHYITWQSLGVDYINIQFSSDAGNTWSTIDSNILNIGYLYWQTNTNSGNNFKIKIINSDQVSMFDESDGIFTIDSPAASINLLAPNGGEQLFGGMAYYIDWQTTNINQIDISYSLDGGANYLPIANNIPSFPPYYYWLVPEVINNSVKIKIAKAGNSNPSDFSQSNFTINSSQPQLNLLYPNGGESLIAGSYKTIKWNAINSNFVNVLLSTDGGIAYNLISSVINDSSYIWYVPSITSGNCIVKIVDAINNSLVDSSNSIFSISPSGAVSNTISITSISNDTVCSGSNLLVNYDVNSSFDPTNNFRVHLSNQSGLFTNFTDIGGVVAGTSGSINCSIPVSISSGANYAIRVVADNPPVVSTTYTNISLNKSNANFTVNNNLILLPNGTTVLTPDENSNNISTSNWLLSNGNNYTSYAPVCNFNYAAKISVTHTIIDTNGCSASSFVPKLIAVEHLFFTEEISNPDSADLVDIGFENLRYGCAIYKNGNCLVTADSGKTWYLSYAAVNSVTLNSISFSSNAWYIAAGNGSYLKSTDKGNTWLQISFGNNESLSEVIFFSNNLAFAVGENGKIFKFNGTIWQNQSTNTNITFNRVARANDKTFVVGNNANIRMFQNNIWSIIAAPINVHFNDIFFKDSLNGYIAGDMGFVLKSIDGGLNWTVALSGADVNFKSLTISGDSIWAVGSDGIVYTSIDNGQNWKRYSIGELHHLNAIWYSNNVGYISGNNGLLRTFNNITYTPLIDEIEEINKNTMLKVFPNPTSDYVLIAACNDCLNDMYNYILTDIHGKTLLSGNLFNLGIDNQRKIDLKHLTEGIYFLTIQSKNKGRSYKVIKIK
jgi:photosystem II stability/assembly factor-like uncharacterized protein